MQFLVAAARSEYFIESVAVLTSRKDIVEKQRQ